MTGPSFTCDHCRTPVSLEADRCPGCGKAFEAVRCPKCGHQGPSASFRNGCPRCRYLATPRPPDPGRGPRRSTFVPTMGVLLVLLALGVGLAWALRWR